MQDRLQGTTMPVLEVFLDPEESVVAESGELSWMTASINMHTSSQYAKSGMFSTFRRAAGGGSFFMTAYTAKGAPGMVAFAAKLPGQIFPVDVSSGSGGSYLGHRHAYLCGTMGVTLSMGFQQRLGAGIFGGEGFRLQHIGGQGRAWVELSGEVVRYELQPNEVLRVHPGHVGLFQDTVQFSITMVKGIRNKLFGGDGIFLAQLVGPGHVWLQSLPLARLAQALAEFNPKQTAEAAAAGGSAGRLFR